MMEQTTGKLSKSTLSRLKEHGKMGDSFDDAVNRVLDEVDGMDEDQEIDDEEPDGEQEDDR